MIIFVLEHNLIGLLALLLLSLIHIFLAVTAGADMILMPADYNTAYTGILNAVNDGTITEERINESVTRIVKAKLAMGQP